MLIIRARLIYKVLLCITLAVSGAQAFAQTVVPKSAQDLRRAAGGTTAQVQAFPDYLSIRSEFLSQVVTAAPVNAFRFRTAIRNSPFGRIRVSLEREDASFFVLFQRERDGDFPYASRGNIIIKRATTTGFIQNIKWFLSDDGNSYLSMTANNERTQIDYIVGGVLVNRNVSVNTMIYYFLIQPFSFLHTTLRSSINWSLVFAERGPAEALDLMAALSAAESNPPANGSRLASLLRAAVNLSELEAYLTMTGAKNTEFAEMTSFGLGQYMLVADERDRGRIVDISPWKSETGYTAKVVPYVLGFETGRLFLAIINCREGQANRNLLILPYADGNGSYQLFCWEPATRSNFDIEAFIADCPEAQVRLFFLPLP